jgi:hypothetical protein
MTSDSFAHGLMALHTILKMGVAGIRCVSCTKEIPASDGRRREL